MVPAHRCRSGARRCSSMGTKHKSPLVLDAMIEHVRYEVMQILQFESIGNAWCGLLRQDLEVFARRSILEAGLIHFRCVIEFLGDAPTSDQVMARDFLPSWDWKISEELTQVRALHGRVADLGIVRRSTTTDSGSAGRPGWRTRHQLFSTAFGPFSFSSRSPRNSDSSCSTCRWKICPTSTCSTASTSYFLAGARRLGGSLATWTGCQ